MNRGKELSIKISFSDSFPKFIQADKKRIRQIILNLMGNAFKFTSQGSICFYAEYIQENNKKENYIRLSVSDTGIGIAKENQSIIFESFRQIQGDPNRTYEGTGLGLAIIKKIVDAHKGKIELKSEINKGTEFFVTLPLSPPQKSIESVKTSKFKENAVSYQSELPKTGISNIQEVMLSKDISTQRIKNHKLSKSLKSQGEHIYVIDDEPLNIEVLRAPLEMNQYSVTGFESAIKALESLKNKNYPDLILLDIMMPEMSGYEFCQYIKENESWKDIPVIIISAKNQLVDRIYGLELGALDYISKPFIRQELLLKIRTFLDIRQLYLKLQELNNTLEQKVELRTIELEQKNKELKRYFLELKQAQKHIIHNEKMIGLGAMSAKIAHELNNSLNFIVANCPILKEDIDQILSNEHKNNREEIHEDINSIIESIIEGSNRSKAIVDSLLSFENLVSSTGDIRKTKSNINNILDNSIELFQSSHQNKILIHRDYLSFENLPIIQEMTRNNSIESNIKYVT